MSVLTDHSIAAAAAALLTRSARQCHDITGAWANPLYREECVAGIEPKLVNLALAVVDYYSDLTFAELEEMRAQDDPLVLAVREELERAKHEIEALHRHIELLTAKNNALRKSMDEASRVTREVDTDFAVMRSTLTTQF
jgi:hypothetical protein